MTIKLCDGKLARTHEEQNFIYEAIRCANTREPYLIFDHFTSRVRKLALEGRTLNDRPIPSIQADPDYHMTYPQSFQHLIEQQGHDWRNFK